MWILSYIFLLSPGFSALCPGRDKLVTFVDDGDEMFYGCDNVCEVIFIDVCGEGIYVVGEGVPLSSIVVGEGAF